MSDDREGVRAEIEAARRTIDDLDEQIVRLLSCRAARVQQIGRAKRRLGESIYQPEREEKIFKRVIAANDGPLDDNALRRLFERILDEARRLERFTYDSDEAE
ncbi:MAG: chorismate mutase [Acidobacteriota bacterium]